RGDVDGEIVALVVGTLGSWARGDIGRLVELAGRAGAIPNSRRDPTIDVALRAIAAIGAEMGGDLVRALDELRDAPLGRVPAAGGLPPGGLVLHCLLLRGGAEEAVAVAADLVTIKSDRTPRYFWAMARWMAGEPEELLALNQRSID